MPIYTRRLRAFAAAMKLAISGYGSKGLDLELEAIPHEALRR